MLFMSCCRFHFLLTVYCMMLPQGSTDFLHSANTWCIQNAYKMVNSDRTDLTKPIKSFCWSHILAVILNYFSGMVHCGDAHLCCGEHCPHTVLFQFNFSAKKYYSHFLESKCHFITVAVIYIICMVWKLAKVYVT